MSAADFLPHKRTLPALRQAVQQCQGCELYRTATQAVFGHGAASASIMLVGEQPGNEEDLQGAPFVGPAGRWLDRALDEAGLERNRLYLTNAVKHFKWEERGKRRLHKRPSAREVKSCHPWLEAELAAVNPRVIVCLGALAAQSLLGKDFRITSSRGEPRKWNDEALVMATWHPAAILRAPDAARRQSMHREFVLDLQRAKAMSEGHSHF